MKKNSSIYSEVAFLQSKIAYWEQVVKLTSEHPNDMDLGQAIRTLKNEFIENSNKPPFTEDYIQ